MSVLFTTGWGALYLGVLLLTMIPALFSPAKRWLALYMVLLFIADRCAVTLMSPSDNAVSLYFLAWAYFMVTIGIVLTHQAKLVGLLLAVTSLAFILGGFGVFDWDITGAIQEVLGYVAMLTIFFGGTKHHEPFNDRAHGARHSGHRAFGLSRRQTPK